MKVFPILPIKFIPAVGAVLLCLMILPSESVFADIVQKIDEGDRAVAIKDYAAAEKFYSQALQMEPDNYRILKSLAEAKVALEKYAEAEPLIERILSMKVLKGKRVMVTLEGESEPLEAELVDETVVLKEIGKNNMRNYLTPVRPEPVPHYRLFFLKEKRMELVPKHRARIKYMGVPLIANEQVKKLQDQVKIKLIGASKSKGPEEMVTLEGGCFSMGSEDGDLDERPVHEVCVSPLKMDKYEVTQREFQLKMGTNPSRFVGADLPVESVTWIEANQYCKKSNKRLPTEAEWEYGSRAGTRDRYYWGDTVAPKKANFCDSSCTLNIRNATISDGFPHTAPVGSFPPNAFGLHDMAGNVAEWVADWMEENYYRTSPKKDPTGPHRSEEVLRGATNYKTVRGGSWENGPTDLRSSSRKGFWVDYRIDGLGFRCAADLK
ncbi:MAG: SUMF1/EgtB/PvdO family nonheme iron enzyme [Nitrospinaceae bacterium]